jgi:hypothetical protein
MNDSLKTDVFVRFTPEAIACACIFLAARQLQVVDSFVFCVSGHKAICLVCLSVRPRPSGSVSVIKSMAG